MATIHVMHTHSVLQAHSQVPQLTGNYTNTGFGNLTLTNMHSLFHQHVYGYTDNLMLTLDQIKTPPPSHHLRPSNTLNTQRVDSHSWMNTMLWKAAADTNTHGNMYTNTDSHTLNMYLLTLIPMNTILWKLAADTNTHGNIYTNTGSNTLNTLCVDSHSYQHYAMSHHQGTQVPLSCISSCILSCFE